MLLYHVPNNIHDYYSGQVKTKTIFGQRTYEMCIESLLLQ